MIIVFSTALSWVTRCCSSYENATCKCMLLSLKESEDVAQEIEDEN